MVQVSIWLERHFLEKDPFDILGLKIQQRNPPIQTVAEREAALNQEWALVPQETIQRLIRCTRRRVQAVISVHGP